MNKTLFLIFHGRFPSEKAAALFAIKNAESFGYFKNVTLLVPRRVGRLKEDPYNFFKVKKNFKIVFLPTIDLFRTTFFSKIAFLLSFVFFSFSCLLYLLLKAKRKDIVYSNESLSLYLISFFFRNSFYEMHDFPTEKSFYFYKKLFKLIRGAIIHNNWKVQKASKFLGIQEGNILCEMNAVEIDEFCIEVTKEVAREKLALPKEKQIVLYTGHLYDWKGVDTLCESASLLPNSCFYIVGGTVKDIDIYKKRFKNIANIFFVGFRPHYEIPLWQKAADVLVIPNTAKQDISKYFTSPMKLFEYMASGRPIVASRIPSIEEIVTEREVCFFEPDNAGDLVLKIKEVSLKDMNDKVLSALEKVKEHSWQNRAKRIIEFIDFKSK